MDKRPQKRGGIPFVLVAAAGVVVVAAITLVLFQGGGPRLSSEQLGPIREAEQNATTQAVGQATRRSVRATGTAYARATSTEAARERQTAATRTSAAVTANAIATVEAVPTQTANAHARETAQVQSAATVEALDERASLIYGPSSGPLEQQAGGTQACSAAAVDLRNFVAEATFHNPADSDDAWDYGIVATNRNEGSEYRFVLASDGSWTFNLHSPGYDISIRDEAPLLDLSRGAPNTLKLYVTEDLVHIYMNGQYVDTLELVMLGLGQSGSTRHDVLVCSGMGEEAVVPEERIGYEEFRVWSLP